MPSTPRIVFSSISLMLTWLNIHQRTYFCKSHLEFHGTINKVQRSNCKIGFARQIGFPLFPHGPSFPCLLCMTSTFVKDEWSSMAEMGRGDKRRKKTPSFILFFSDMLLKKANAKPEKKKASTVRYLLFSLNCKQA